ncbi:hypothetical protein MHYP_G00074060 [Metynnis hypsauchen]
MDLHEDDRDARKCKTEVQETLETDVYRRPRFVCPALLTYKPESKKPLEKVPVESTGECSRDQMTIQCDFCQKTITPFISRGELENNPNAEQLFCCAAAWAARKLLLDVERTLKAGEIRGNTDVWTHPSFTTKHAKRAARDSAETRLRQKELQRAPESSNQNRFQSGGSQFTKISYRLSDQVWTSQEEPLDRHLEVNETTDAPALPENLPRAEPTKGHVLMKFYPDGSTFLVLFPDGTGSVFYPSGAAALIISSAEAGDSIYIVMQDKQQQADMLAIFTSKGRSTCYYPNGRIRLNVTQLGGTYWTETGVLRRRWTWPYPETRFPPMFMALNKHVSLRIHNQSRVCLRFTAHRNRARFNLGSKHKPSHPEGPAASTTHRPAA